MSTPKAKVARLVTKLRSTRRLYVPSPQGATAPPLGDSSVNRTCTICYKNSFLARWVFTCVECKNQCCLSCINKWWTSKPLNNFARLTCPNCRFEYKLRRREIDDADPKQTREWLILQFANNNAAVRARSPTPPSPLPLRFSPYPAPSNSSNSSSDAAHSTRNGPETLDKPDAFTPCRRTASLTKASKFLKWMCRFADGSTLVYNVDIDDNFAAYRLKVDGTIEALGRERRS